VQPRDTAKVTIYRGGRKMDISVTLSELSGIT
jgi:S1-C subfamily serine protease